MAMTGGERAQLEAGRVRTAALERQLEAFAAELAEYRALLEDARRHRLAQDKELAAVRAQRDGFAAEVEALKSRLLVQEKNSSNSSTPPSADPIAVQRRYPVKPKSGLKPGGQAGHPGVCPVFTDEPDEVLQHRPTHCPSGHALHAELEATTGEARQVVDIVRRRVVTEHQVLDVTCPTCAVTTRGTFPLEVSGRVSYGPGVKRAVLLASCGGQLPARATRALVDGVYGVKVSIGALDLWRTGLAQSLTGFDTLLVAALKASPVLGADETPIRVAGFANAHIHTAQTTLLTRFHLAGRGRVDIEAGGVLTGYAGTLTHDCLSSYWKVAAGAHQVCWAHLVRELTFFDQAFTPHDKGAAHPWPQFAALAALARSAIHDRNVAHDAGADPPGSAAVKKAFGALLGPAIERVTAAPNGGATLRAALVLLRRLRRLHADLWGFLDDFEVPPTNNGSEQALRTWKVKQRRSGTFRSADAARQWLLIGSYLDTARKHGHAPEQALDAALAGRPFVPAAMAQAAA